jgi:hypothetical protein
MKTTILTSIFLLITFISFSQVTYSKDVFGNTVAKDQYGNVISTYSKDVFGNTVEKDQYGNTKSTQSKDVLIYSLYMVQKFNIDDFVKHKTLKGNFIIKATKEISYADIKAFAKAVEIIVFLNFFFANA